jgi:hypothetical protein
MFSESSTNRPAKPAPIKRSLFNKPSWSRPENLGSPADLFHRANHTYVDLAAEAERKRKAKLARKERERARQEGSEERAEKRRRVSDESDDDDQSSSDEDSKISEENKARADQTKPKANSTTEHASSVEPHVSPRSLSKRYEKSVAAPKITKQGDSYLSKIIDLENEEDEKPSQQRQDDDEDDDLQVTTIRPSKPRDPDDEFPSDEEEFPELARKAREKARRKRLEAEIEHATPDTPPSVSESGYTRRSQSVQQQNSPPPADAVVQILITSRIANTEPLIVSRKITQRLKDVRVTWCQRQGFTPDFMNSVFLTWRGKRLFDVTTCKSLGIAVDQDGIVLMKGQRDILGEEDWQIHMEAMTEEILEQYKKEKKHAAGEGDTEDHEGEEELVAQPKQEAQVRIILRAKGVDDFKLIVKPVSSIFHFYDLSSFANDCSLLSYHGLSTLSGQPTKWDQKEKSFCRSTETAWLPGLRWRKRSSATWTTLMSISSKP